MANNSSTTAASQLLHEAGLGSLPSKWSIVTVEHLLSNDRGISVGVMYPGDHDPSGVPLIKAGDLSGNLISPVPEFRISQAKHQEYRRTELSGGELVLSLVGEIGRCAVVTPEMAGWNAARAIAVIRLAEPRDAQYLRYCFLSAPTQHLMQAWATTTVQATLNLKEIRQIPIAWPPKRIRDRVAIALSAFDNKIDLNRRMNETLEAMARALFKSWFIDFDPVRAKAAGRQPTGLAPAVSKLFPHRFEGSIPAGWREGAIADLAETNGWTLAKNDPLAQIDYIEISEVMRGEVSNVQRYARGEEPSRARHRLRHGDTVLSTVRPDRGAYFLCLNPAESLIASTGFAVVTPKNAPWSFIHCALTQPEVFQHLGHHAHGGAYPAVSTEVISGYTIAFPENAEVLDAFNIAVRPLLELADHNRAECRQLAAARDALLPKLLSGELDVSAVEAGKQFSAESQRRKDARKHK